MNVKPADEQELNEVIAEMDRRLAQLRPKVERLMRESDRLDRSPAILSTNFNLWSQVTKDLSRALIACVEAEELKAAAQRRLAE